MHETKFQCLRCGIGVLSYACLSYRTIPPTLVGGGPFCSQCQEEKNSVTKPILSMDFDGVIHSYTSGWTSADHVADSPVPGAIDFLRRASEHFTVAVYSSRSHQSGGLNAMQQWLAEHMHNVKNYPESKPGEMIDVTWFSKIIWATSKPSAMISIDDRAITFTGAWPDMRDLIDFRPWNKPATDGTPRHSRAIPNIDAPKYFNLEGRYYAALDLLLEAAQGGDVHDRAMALVSEGTARHPLNLDGLAGEQRLVRL